MTAPRRIQRKRAKGWRMPKGAVYVGRPGRWANNFEPWKLSVRPGGSNLPVRPTSQAQCVRLYRQRLAGDAALAAAARAELAGRDLACWCALCPKHAKGKPAGEACRACEPCHADVLLEIANGP